MCVRIAALGGRLVLGDAPKQRREQQALRCLQSCGFGDPCGKCIRTLGPLRCAASSVLLCHTELAWAHRDGDLLTQLKVQAQGGNGSAESREVLPSMFKPFQSGCTSDSVATTRDSCSTAHTS